MQGVRRTAATAILTDYEFVKFYREYISSLSKPKNKRISSTGLIQLCVSEIFKHVADDLVNNKAGVVLRRIGYFGIWRVPEISILPTSYRYIELNEHSEGYQYVIDFFPESTSNKLMSIWRMDRMFNNSLKKRISKKLKSGFKYSNLYFTLKEYKKQHIKL